MRRNRWILVAVIFMVICVVAAAAEDLPGSLPTLSSREIRFSRGNKYPVYSGPGDAYLRGGKGKAAVSTNDWIQVFGQENGWILIQYEINSSHCRIGYITAQSLPKNADVPDLSFPRQTAYTIAKTTVTDDPLRSGSALADLPAGAEVTMLARLGKDVYIEGKAKNQFRGFVPSDSLSLSPDSRTPIDWDQAEKRRDADLESAEKNRAYDALGMWLRETEGIVSLLDQDGNPLELETDMRMSSGTALETEEKSLAAVDMDLKRLAILAETSRAGFLTSNQGAGISIALQAGEMYFRVGQPLEDDESFEIVIDDIVLAIRGTCGLVQIGEAEQSVLLASGHATMARITEETETEEEEEIPVAPGEMVSVAKQTDGSISVSRRDISEEEVPEFLVEALRKDPEQLEKVYEETGWDAELLFDGDIPTTGTAVYMDAYQKIIAQASTYNYGLDNGRLSYTRSGDHYQYALVYLEVDDDIPVLLLRSRTTNDGRYVRVFRYDPESRTAVEVKQTPIADGYGGMYTEPDSRGFMQMVTDDTGRRLMQYYLANNTLRSKKIWAGSWDQNPDFTLVQIPYTDIE